MAERLRIPVPVLVNWLVGVETVPHEVFLKAVDIVLAATAEDIGRSRELLNRLRTRH